MMIHIIYEGSRPCGFRQEDFFHVFPTSDYVKHVTPRVGPFFAPWLNFNKLGRGLLVDATYQISRLYA